MAFNRVRDLVVEQLNSQGIYACTAWSRQKGKGAVTPLVTVAMQGCHNATVGFQDYLGERENPETGHWEEIYGKQVELTFTFGLWVEGQAGEVGCQTLFDSVVAALSHIRPGGIVLKSISRGEISYDQMANALYCPAEVALNAHLYAVAQQEGIFEDFIVKGEGL